jgi:hypothetical protein
MVGANDVVATLQHTLDSAQRCASEETTQHYDALIQDLDDFETLARGYCEGHADWRSLVGKLRSDMPLSPQDLATLRLLVVGDADYYVKYDEERDRCAADIARIVGEIKSLQAGELTPELLMRLGVLCREARGLAAMSRHYFESRERVRRFEAATAGTIDAGDRRTLVGIVEEMVRSARAG